MYTVFIRVELLTNSPRDKTDVSEIPVSVWINSSVPAAIKCLLPLIENKIRVRVMIFSILLKHSESIKITHTRV